MEFTFRTPVTPPEFLIAEVSLAHKSLGSLNTDIAYTGSAKPIDLIKISLPPWDRDLSNQPWSLFCSYSLMKLRIFFLEPLKTSARPK